MEAQKPHRSVTPEPRWDELFARPDAKQLMRQMAQEAQADYHAGRTTEIMEGDTVIWYWIGSRDEYERLLS